MNRSTLGLALACVLAAGIGCGSDAAAPADGGDTDAAPDDFEGDEPGECNDGIDNDRDGPSDCADPGCAGAPVCAGADADGDADGNADTGGDGDADGDGDAGADGDADADADDGGPSLETVHFNGRFDRTDPAAPSFEWSGTTIAARFSGTGARVVLDAQGDNYFEVLVDGSPSSVVATVWGEQTLTLATGLAAGEHDVAIVRRTEAFFNPVAFLRFEVDAGDLVPSPSPWRHRLEFIGDSITAGYGALGVGPSCSFSGDTESAYVSYASVAARALAAAAHLIAWSGKGVYQNYGGDRAEPMPAIYERTLPTDPASRWDFSFQAEAVVINLGTNDFSATVDQDEFEAAYAGLIRLVRSHHVAAAIYCVAGEFLNPTATTYIGNAIAAVGDPGVHLLELPGPEASEGWGCDWHPSAATHARLGALVADRLRSDLGW